MNKRNPFGSDADDMRAVFEEAKRLAAQKQEERFAARASQAWAAQEAQDQFAAQLANAQAPPGSFLEGLRPYAGELRLRGAPPPGPRFAATSAEVAAQLAEVKARRERLSTGARFGVDGSILGPGGAPDAAAEAARVGLGMALSAAVAAGLLSEDRAVAMIVAGGINDRPLGPGEARDLLAASVAQAVLSEALSEDDAARIAAIVEPDRPSGEPGGAGAARYEGLIYDAMLMRPCHLSEHDEYHRDSSDPCVQQAAEIGRGLLSGLGDPPPTALPRAPHANPDGSRAACCARDGRIGTWLVYGRTLDPAARFASDGPRSSDLS